MDREKTKLNNLALELKADLERVASELDKQTDFANLARMVGGAAKVVGAGISIASALSAQLGTTSEDSTTIWAAAVANATSTAGHLTAHGAKVLQAFLESCVLNEIDRKWEVFSGVLVLEMGLGKKDAYYYDCKGLSTKDYSREHSEDIGTRSKAETDDEDEEDDEPAIASLMCGKTFSNKEKGSLYANALQMRQGLREVLDALSYNPSDVAELLRGLSRCLEAFIRTGTWPLGSLQPLSSVLKELGSSPFMRVMQRQSAGVKKTDAARCHTSSIQSSYQIVTAEGVSVDGECASYLNSKLANVKSKKTDNSNRYGTSV